jgi:hypothetical protein
LPNKSAPRADAWGDMSFVSLSSILVSIDPP